MNFYSEGALKSGGKLNKRKRNQIVEDSESDEEQTNQMMNKLIEEESQNELDEESERDTESSERGICFS